MRKINYLFVLLGVLISCNNNIELEDQTSLNATDDQFSMNNINYSVVDGVLSFNSSSDFYALGERLSEMATDHLKNWENKIGFVSLKSELEVVFNELDACETVEEYETVLAKNSDIIQIEDSTESPIIKNSFEQRIVNRKGHYIVNGTFHKISSEGVFASGNSFQQIEKAVLNSSDTEELNVKFMPLSDKKCLLKSTNSQYLVYDETNWHSSRKCYAELELFWVATNNGDNWTYKFYTTCVSKSIGRTLIGTKKLYNSNHYCSAFSASFQIPYRLNTGGANGYYYTLGLIAKSHSSEGPVENVKTKEWWSSVLLMDEYITVSESVMDIIGRPFDYASIRSVDAQFWTSGTGEDHKATLYKEMN